MRNINMEAGIAKYFDRAYYRKLEKRFEIKPIVYCWWFNFIIALVTFNISMYVFGDIVISILYTMVAWTATLTISILYWILWVQRRLKGGKNVKMVASTAILVLFAIALVFIFHVIGMVMYIIR